MFSIHCPQHGTEVLLSERRIRSIVPTDTGIRVHYECSCGHRGSFRTGRPAMVGRHRPAV